MKKNTSTKEKVAKKESAAKTTKVSAAKAKAKTKKSTSKKKKEVEDLTFEERAFANDKKKKTLVVKDTKKTNMVPVIVGIMCVVLVVGIVALIKNNKFTLMETKKIETVEETSTEKVTETMVVETTTAVKEIRADISALKREMPCYDVDIYSEGAMYAYDNDLLKEIQIEIDDLQNDEVYEDMVDEGKKDIITVNKIMLDNYLDNYNASYKKEYDAIAKRDYISDVVNGAKEKKGKNYYSDYIAVSLFSEAKDKGFYYEVPSSFYKKVTIKKYAFDKMEIGAKGSISLPLGENDALVATEVIKESGDAVSYTDKEGAKKILKLIERSDVEYALQYEDTGAYVLVFYLNDNVSVLKDARVGHGKNMEYVAYNYLRYPTDINFEVYVKAEDIVNKTSTNDMLNGQWINSSKQVWDEKGFLVSLVYFE